MIIVHSCLTVAGDQSLYGAADCGRTAIEFFGEAVHVEFFDPLTLWDFDRKVRSVFGQKNQAHKVHVREHLGNRGAVGQCPKCERAGRQGAQKVNENAMVAVPGVEKQVQECGVALDRHIWQFMPPMALIMAALMGRLGRQ